MIPASLKPADDVFPQIILERPSQSRGPVQRVAHCAVVRVSERTEVIALSIFAANGDSSFLSSLVDDVADDVHCITCIGAQNVRVPDRVGFSANGQPAHRGVQSRAEVQMSSVVGCLAGARAMIKAQESGRACEEAKAVGRNSEGGQADDGFLAFDVVFFVYRAGRQFVDDAERTTNPLAEDVGGQYAGMFRWLDRPGVGM